MKTYKQFINEWSIEWNPLRPFLRKNVGIWTGGMDPSVTLYRSKNDPERKRIEDIKNKEEELKKQGVIITKKTKWGLMGPKTITKYQYPQKIKLSHYTPTPTKQREFENPIEHLIKKKMMMTEWASDKKGGGGGGKPKGSWVVLWRKKTVKKEKPDDNYNGFQPDRYHKHGHGDSYRWTGNYHDSHESAIEAAEFDNSHPLMDKRFTAIPMHVRMARKLLGKKD